MSHMLHWHCFRAPLNFVCVYSLFQAEAALPLLRPSEQPNPFIPRANCRPLTTTGAVPAFSQSWEYVLKCFKTGLTFNICPKPLVELTTVDPGVVLQFFGSHRRHHLQTRQNQKVFFQDPRCWRHTRLKRLKTKNVRKRHTFSLLWYSSRHPLPMGLTKLPLSAVCPARWTSAINYQCSENLEDQKKLALFCQSCHLPKSSCQLHVDLHWKASFLTVKASIHDSYSQKPRTRRYR